MIRKNKILLTISILIAIIFILFPQIDLWISAIFFKDNTFFLQNDPIVLFIFNSAYYIGQPLIIVLLLLLVVQYGFKKEVFSLKRKDILYISLVALIGVVLIVNIIFKDSWDRARPYTIKEFGGTKEFTPAFIISNQCEDNCSFTCGHASFGYFFLAFWFVYKKRWLFYFAITYGTILGLGRIIQGNHFLSDVVFSFVFIYIVAYFLHYIMYKEKVGYNYKK